MNVIYRFPDKNINNPEVDIEEIDYGNFGENIVLFREPDYFKEINDIQDEVVNIIDYIIELGIMDYKGRFNDDGTDFEKETIVYGIKCLI